MSVNVYLINLPGRHHAARNLRAYHLNARLPLSIDAAAEAKGTKLVVGQFPGQEVGRLSAEQLDIIAYYPVVFVG